MDRFLAHQIEPWVNMNLWPKQFFGQKRPSAGKVFQKCQNWHFSGFWPLKRIFTVKKGRLTSNHDLNCVYLAVKRSTC